MTSEDIKKLRESLGLSQQQFAALVGSSIKTISNWETGGKIPAAHVSGCASLDKALDEIASQRRLTEDALSRLAKAQAQVDDLIEILKSKM